MLDCRIKRICFVIIWFEIQVNFLSCLEDSPTNISDTANPVKNPFLTSKFENIPTILNNGENNGRDKIKWYVGEALNAVTQKFSTVLLTTNQWNSLTTEVSDDAPGLPNIIIDYSDSSLSTWNAVGTNLMNNKLVNKYLKWIAIPVLQTTVKDTDSAFNYLKRFSDKITEQNKSLEIGCVIKNTESSSQLEDIGRRCIENGGKFIINSITIDLKDLDEHHFLRTQSQLNKTKEIRLSINKTNPEVIIYIRITTTGASSLEKDYEATVFCKEDALHVNEFYDRILNWAQHNEFPVILKSAFETGLQPSVTSWMSMLRPTYIGGALSGDTLPLSTTHPIFVLRNYPSSINGWKTEPCIPWPKQEEIPAFYVSNFLESNQTGAILKMNLRQSQPIIKEEFQNMIQFVLHKFSFAELVVRDPYEFSIALDALGPQFIQKIASFFPNQKLKLYVNYQMGGELSPDKIALFYPKVRDFRKNNLISAEGVHFDYSLVHDGKNNLFSFLAATSSTVQIGIEIQSNYVLQHVFNKSSEIRRTLELSKYVICVELIDVELEGSDINIMGKMFDQHLYVKKILEKVKPGLALFYRLEMNVDLKVKNGEKSMQQYKRLISMVQTFGAYYDIQYFMVEAFDMENNVGKKNGWWMINNYTDMTNFDAYVEKDTAMKGIATWKPQERILKPESTSTDANSTGLLVGIFSGVTIILLAVATVSFLFVFRYRRMHKLYLTSQEVLEFRNGDKPQDGNVVNHKFNTEFELQLNDINIDYEKVLGAGQFGTVYRGTVKGQPAAIKTPNKNCGKVTFINVLGEVKVLCHLGSHQHIVSFLGAYVNEIQNGKLHIATQLCENGSLEIFLRNKKASMQHLQNFQMYANVINGEGEEMEALRQVICQFSLEIARGMEYIACKNVVHGDLAARNVLLDSNLVCKIGDFGLSRKLYEYQKYTKSSQEPLPWKWMAIESLTQMEFTPMSDVWSYGVTVWEIFTLGEIPYAGLHWSPQYSNELRNGLRLPPPQFASHEIYEKLQACWNLNAEQRPTFEEMVEFFLGLRSKEYLEIVPL